MAFKVAIEVEREDDGRWIADRDRLARSSGIRQLQGGSRVAGRSYCAKSTGRQDRRRATRGRIEFFLCSGVSYWPSCKAKQVFRALLRLGWEIKNQKGSSHMQIVHEAHGEATGAFHDSEEIGPKMMARISKQYHFTP